MQGKVSLGFHAIGGEGGNAKLSDMLAEGKGINVIAPTWFSLTDNDGNFRSFASTQYVEQAHGSGLQVWGVWDNFNYKNETGTEVKNLMRCFLPLQREESWPRVSLILPWAWVWTALTLTLRA